MVNVRDRALPMVVAALAGILAAAIGPGLVAGRGRTLPSSAAFTYAPPPGFVPAGEDLEAVFGADRGGDPARRSSLWVWSDDATGTPLLQRRVNVSMTHANKRAPLDDASLAHLAEGMPATYAASGQSWALVRHGVHVRPDGGRVGVLEGTVRGGPFAFRSLQFAFPESDGAAIVTASFAEADAARWEPAFDATLDTATGVLVNGEPEAPSLRAYLVWGFLGALLSYGIARGLLGLAARPRVGR